MTDTVKQSTYIINSHFLKVTNLKKVDKENMSDEVWATPGFVQGMSFYFRHHGRFYKMEPGAVLFAYLIFDTNDDLFEQHTH